ncbi:predicted protein [Aspergillus terreus NIH2624]|uniref:Uncharacterized protein n=1 Tax=Aspergillus terreus (strain NIH 2624 / FGSC A1156) TaxID=341663 RepID=Q0CV42_ASPTN|nr:uncharacterized protein ATEG_02442 [Aspergillus terreus NIH2624]EAU37404.1 predicted protein [Aspergillus terreus NIH2624]
MESSALIPNQTGPGFSQQGTVDWTQLAKSSVALSLEILSRPSKAGVEPLTLAMGQAIFSRFQLPPSTQQKIHTVLGNLKPFSSYSNILWFGFGVKHVVRLLVESEQGMTCVALCGGLSVSYDRFYCAQVLRSMTQIQEAPANLSPSITQWSNLVDSCSGTLLSSDFPNMVEGFSRLWYNGAGQDAWKRHGATSPHALGKALSTLAAISSGSLQSATFVGGADCAWVAAVAEWVLGLAIEVIDAQTGDCLYQKLGKSNDETGQVRILRTLDTQYSMVHVRDTTCFLPSGAEIFHACTEVGDYVFAGGWSTWDTILSDTFPADALQRLTSSKAGPAFAYALRMTADQMNTELGGRKNILEMLPELRPVLSNPRSQDLTLTDAEWDVQSSCGCHCCQNPREKQPPTYVRPRELSQNINNNVLATILHTMTGIPVQGELSLRASAISDSGMLICCTSLLIPNLPPTEMATFHLVPGHIQKDGSFFREVYDLNPKPGLRIEEDTVMQLTFDEKLRLMMSFRQNESIPELLVKETIQSRKLQANYSWQYRLFNDQFRDKHQAPVAASTTSTKMLVTAFGSADLQRLLFKGISLPHCESKRMKATTTGNRTVSGTCLRTTEDIRLQMRSPPSGFPRPGEWVLLDIGRQKQPGGYDGEEFPTKLYLGSLVELYSLLCNSEPGKHLKLASPSETVIADNITRLQSDGQDTEDSNAASTLENVDEVVASAVGIDVTAPAPLSPSPPQETKSKKRKSTKGTRRNGKRRAGAR